MEETIGQSSARGSAGDSLPPNITVFEAASLLGVDAGTLAERLGSHPGELASNRLLLVEEARKIRDRAARASENGQAAGPDNGDPWFPHFRSDQESQPPLAGTLEGASLADRRWKSR